ncbi:hypothetical protein [Salinifilum aidingensis]
MRRRAGPQAFFGRRFFPNTHHHSWDEQIFHTVRSEAECPAVVTSSCTDR